MELKQEQPILCFNYTMRVLSKNVRRKHIPSGKKLSRQIVVLEIITIIRQSKRNLSIRVCQNILLGTQNVNTKFFQNCDKKTNRIALKNFRAIGAIPRDKPKSDLSWSNYIFYESSGSFMRTPNKKVVLLEIRCSTLNCHVMKCVEGDRTTS